MSAKDQLIEQPLKAQLSALWQHCKYSLLIKAHTFPEKKERQKEAGSTNEQGAKNKKDPLPR